MTSPPEHHAVVPGPPRPAGAYSHAVRHGDQLWTCGLGPHDPETGAIPDGIEAQTEQALDNLERLLRGCGAHMSDVLQMRVFLADLEGDFAAYDQVYARRLTAPYPVRTTVGAQLLGFLIEIDAVCAAPPDQPPS